MKDCVYYIQVGEEVMYELIFNSEELAIEWAEENLTEAYHTIEWEVD